MKVNRAIITPFNNWWRKTNHCEPDLKAIEAFEAGFVAGVEASKSVLNTSQANPAFAPTVPAKP